MQPIFVLLDSVLIAVSVPSLLVRMTLYIFEPSANKYISELGSSAAQRSGRTMVLICFLMVFHSAI